MPEPPPDPPSHHYLSTACYHRHHGECRRTCKFCPTGCVCSCHPRGDEAGKIEEGTLGT